MKKITLIALVSLLSISIVFAQEDDSRRFLKRIENNYTDNIVMTADGKTDGTYNLDSKKGVEKLFFGDFNAKVEYFLEPSFTGAFGFRIYRDSTEKYILEVKNIPNYKEVRSALEKEFPLQGSKTLSISEKRSHKMVKHNRAMIAKIDKESVKRYQIATKSVPISDVLAEKLYTRTVTAIDTYKPPVRVVSSLTESRMILIILDGSTSTFRTVVGDDVWTFTIHQPVGYIEKLSDLFKQIITDVDTENFDESKYIKLLDN